MSAADERIWGRINELRLQRVALTEERKARMGRLIENQAGASLGQIQAEKNKIHELSLKIRALNRQIEKLSQQSFDFRTKQGVK